MVGTCIAYVVGLRAARRRQGHVSGLDVSPTMLRLATDPARVFREISRILKPSGRLVLGWHHDEETIRSFPASVYRFLPEDEVARLPESAGLRRKRLVQRQHGKAVLHLAVAQKASP